MIYTFIVMERSAQLALPSPPIIIKMGAAPNREHFVQTRYPPCYRQSDTDDITASTSNPPQPSTITDAGVVFEVLNINSNNYYSGNLYILRSRPPSSINVILTPVDLMMKL